MLWNPDVSILKERIKQLTNSLNESFEYGYTLEARLETARSEKRHWIGCHDIIAEKFGAMKSKVEWFEQWEDQQVALTHIQDATISSQKELIQSLREQVANLKGQGDR